MALLNARYVEKDSTFCQGIIKSGYFPLSDDARVTKCVTARPPVSGNDALILPHAPDKSRERWTNRDRCRRSAARGTAPPAKTVKHFRQKLGDTPGPSSEIRGVMPAGVVQRHIKMAAIAPVTERIFHKDSKRPGPYGTHRL
jgi:hypothetical protein